MAAFHRQFMLVTLKALRQSRLRPLILRLLTWLHNISYHQISFFASHEGIHPKHAIQNYQRFFMAHVAPTDRVLDVGSGNGAVAWHVAAVTQQVVGIDINPANIAKAQRTYQRENLEFIVGDATTYTFDQKFDVIILSNVLEHIADRIGLLNKLQQLAPTILIRVPMLSRDWITVYKQQAGLEYRLDDTHEIEYTPETFAAEMQAAHLAIASYHVNFGEIYAVTRSATASTEIARTVAMSTAELIPPTAPAPNAH